MEKKEFKKHLKKIWYFIWEDDSIWSWIVNIILAFVLIKYIVYPGLGLILGTGFPIVAVVSESMEHDENFDDWWKSNGNWYINEGINKPEFSEFIFRNGFSKGDIMILKGADPENLDVGEVLVFISHTRNPKPDPIIHRVMSVWKEEDDYFFKTKGDNNRGVINSCLSDGCVDETKITEEQIVGKAIFRIPLLGWIKIIFVEIVRFIAVFINGIIG